MKTVIMSNFILVGVNHKTYHIIIIITFTRCLAMCKCDSHECWIATLIFGIAIFNCCKLVLCLGGC